MNPSSGSRRYRSKNQRPCDLCRSRKVMCNIPQPSQACQLCHRTGRKCTFLAQPAKKTNARASSVSQGATGAVDRSPQESWGTTNLGPGQPGTENLVENGLESVSWPYMNENSPISPPGISPQGLNVEFQNSPLGNFGSGSRWEMGDTVDWMSGLGQEPLSIMDFSFDSITDLPRDSAQDLPQTIDRYTNTAPDKNNESPINISGTTDLSNLDDLSLDKKTSFTDHWFGFTNESDPFLLDRLPSDSRDELKFYRLIYRNMRDGANQAYQESMLPPDLPPALPLHFLRSHRQTAMYAQEMVTSYLTDKSDIEGSDDEQLQKLVDPELGAALITLYIRYCFHALPLLSRSQVFRNVEQYIREASTGVLAGIYALALPFTSWDEKLCVDKVYSKPSPSELWRICYRCLQREIHFPKLSTIQMSLLMLNQIPRDVASPDNPSFWSLASSTFAVSLTLGLHIDPSRWKLPQWEVRLRRRLWWCVFVEHTWRALTQGRPSMISHENWNVRPLTGNDFVVDLNTYQQQPEESTGMEYFVQLCAITTITDDICKSFYSLRAIEQSNTLEELIEMARLPRRRLQAWSSALPATLKLQPPSEDDNDSIRIQASLHLAYFTTQTMIFRALLRPILGEGIELSHLPGEVEAILSGSQNLLQAMIRFVRGLDVRDFSAFWPGYTRTAFCYPGQFVLMLVIQRRAPQTSKACVELMAIWRQLLRTRAQAWPLLRLPALTVDATYYKDLDKLGEQDDSNVTN